MFRSYCHLQVEIYALESNITGNETDRIHATGCKHPSLKHRKARVLVFSTTFVRKIFVGLTNIWRGRCKTTRRPISELPCPLTPNFHFTAVHCSRKIPFTRWAFCARKCESPISLLLSSLVTPCSRDVCHSLRSRSDNQLLPFLRCRWEPLDSIVPVTDVVLSAPVIREIWLSSNRIKRETTSSCQFRARCHNIFNRVKYSMTSTVCSTWRGMQVIRRVNGAQQLVLHLIPKLLTEMRSLYWTVTDWKQYNVDITYLHGAWSQAEIWNCETRPNTLTEICGSCTMFSEMWNGIKNVHLETLDQSILCR
jgi:hypothetical protein